MGKQSSKQAWVALSAAVALAIGAAPAGAQSVRGQYCAVAAPHGWAITGEQATRTAFGADFRRNDGGAYASYFVVGVAAEMRQSAWYGRYYATPEAGVMATLSKMGTEQVQCSTPVGLASGVRQMQCRTAALSGLVAYQVQPMPNGGYVLTIRTAATPHGQWPRFGAEASAVAGALRCNVPFLPSPPDPPSAGGSGKAKGKGERDSQYSRWLGREHYHDPKTGENYWVEPGRDWVQNGRDGPGYYVGSGNELRKLEPGRSD
jgi:hypothetical protein